MPGGAGATGVGTTGATGVATTGATGVGTTGATGVATTGATGVAGGNAYTTTTAGFTQPSVGATVSVSVVATAWMVSGQFLYMTTGGFYAVSSITNSTTVVLTNLGYTGNAAPTTVIATTGLGVSPAGIVGVSGATGVGTAGATGVGTTGATGVGTTGATGVGTTGATGAGTTGATGVSWSPGVITPTAISANTNDWNPTSLATATFIRLTVTGASSWNLTGITAQASGTVIDIANVGGANSVVLVQQSGSSTAANRFITTSAGNVTVAPGQNVRIIYDGTTLRWRFLGPLGTGL